MTEQTGKHVSEILGKIEGQNVTLRAEFKTTDPAEQQRLDDDRLIPSPGDVRVMVQQGKIMAPDGETVILTELTFIRQRTESGGVSVICQIPPLAMAGESMDFS